MKTKTYKFEIKIDFPETEGTFLESLRKEVEDDKRQLEMTHKINAETSRIHEKVLKDFIKDVKKEIDAVIKSIVFSKTTYTNRYHLNRATITLINGHEIELRANPKDTKVEGTKYTTFSGGVYIERMIFPDFSSNAFSGIDSVDHLLTNNKGEIKKCLSIIM